MERSAATPDRQFFWGQEMRYLITGMFFCFAFTAQAENDCTRASVRWAEDPLLLSNEGLTAYVTPAMISINEAGEYFVENTAGFFDEEPMAFFSGSDGNEYARVVAFSNEDFTGTAWLTMEELDAWVIANYPK